ncbi:MAG: DUF2786 domain-containing protein [Prevotellaceae bacterium]|jgi:hypothetical protein|nr:DUF2786 domain-containing protein [Prevotellaceae bacterium]
MTAPQNILERLKKLIRKHKSCVEIGQIQEAEAAMLAINRLLTEYNLSLEDLYKIDSKTDTTPPEVTIIEGDKIWFRQGAEFQFVQKLAAVIAKYNYCKAVSGNLGTASPFMKIIGTEINVQTCQFLFSFLYNNFTFNGDKSAKAYSYEPLKKINFYKDFLAGTVAGIADKLEQEQNAQTTAIIKWNSKAIDSYLEEKNVYKLAHPKDPHARRLNANAWYAGRKHGQSVKIAKGISNKKNINQ